MSEHGEANSVSLADSGAEVGVDVGATLAKLALRERASGELQLDYWPAVALDELAERVRTLGPRSLGLTGCGAAALAERMDRPHQRFLEFTAWGAGAERLLAGEGRAPSEPYLLVSVGTGTSVLRIANGEVERVGGTALGGGTVLGLGVALTGCKSYSELAELATRGVRGRVDLLVSDIYRPGEIALPGDITAACFGNLARGLAGSELDTRAEPSRSEDLAAAVMGLVGENVALICCGLAEGAGVSEVIFGGATLHRNPTLSGILGHVTTMLGHRSRLLPRGGFAGAVGALALARAAR